MNDRKHPEFQSSAPDTLEKLVMDPNIPKSEAEWWACREITRLRARVEELTDALIDARHNGLIYWNPVTERGAVERAAMMARIDKVLNKEAKP